MPQYTQHKAKSLAQSTIARDYGKVAKRINRLPESSVAARAYLLREYSDETARRTLKAISGCLEWAVLRGYAEKNPYAELAVEIKVTKNKSRSRQAFSASEVAAILEAIETDRYCSKYAPVKHSYYLGFITFIYLTGCRLEEAIALRWVHVSEEGIHFCEAIPTDCKKFAQATNTYQDREFPLNGQMRIFLASLPRSYALVFPSPSGFVIDCHNLLPRVWRKVLLPLIAEGKVRQYLPTYKLRHTAITRWIKAGII